MRRVRPEVIAPLIGGRPFARARSAPALFSPTALPRKIRTAAMAAPNPLSMLDHGSSGGAGVEHRQQRAKPPKLAP